MLLFWCILLFTQILIPTRWDTVLHSQHSLHLPFPLLFMNFLLHPPTSIQNNFPYGEEIIPFSKAFSISLLLINSISVCLKIYFTFTITCTYRLLYWQFSFSTTHYLLPLFLLKTQLLFCGSFPWFFKDFKDIFFFSSLVFNSFAMEYGFLSIYPALCPVCFLSLWVDIFP